MWESVKVRRYEGVKVRRYEGAKVLPVVNR